MEAGWCDLIMCSVGSVDVCVSVVCGFFGFFFFFLVLRVCICVWFFVWSVCVCLELMGGQGVPGNATVKAGE